MPRLKMRKSEKRQSIEFGIGNAEVGKKTEGRVLNSELGMRKSEKDKRPRTEDRGQKAGLGLHVSGFRCQRRRRLPKAAGLIQLETSM